MKKALFIINIALLVSSCFPVAQRNKTEMNQLGQVYDQRVHEFADIPHFLLDSINNMGIDHIPVLNEFEGSYINYIFKVNLQTSNLMGKRVCFLRGGSLKTKADYFNETRDRYIQNYSLIGGSSLYIFDETQKKESGGYDAAIVYWSKFAIPMDDVIKRLKESGK